LRRELIRIGILATHETEEQQRLVEAATQRGHEAKILKVLDFSINICNDDPRMYYCGELVASDHYDIIVPRIDIPDTSYGYKVLRQFQALGVYAVDTAYSLELARNKLRCFQYLMRHKVPFPATAFSYASEGYKRILKAIGEPPFVIKLNEGTQGIGVFLAENKKQAINFLRTFEQFDAEIMLQEFIGESSGEDLRCFVVGDKVVAAMRREAQDDDFRANISLGGHAFKADLSEDEERIALEAAKALKLSIGGIDIIRSDRGPLVIEINGAPDFCGEWGLEAVSGVDVAGAIIEHAEEGKEKHEQGDGVWLADAIADAIV